MVELSEKEIEQRCSQWKAPPERYSRGVFKKYVQLVQSASFGATTS